MTKAFELSQIEGDTDTALALKAAITYVDAADDLKTTLNPSVIDKGSVTSGTVTFTVSAGRKQKLTVGGALTIATAGWPTTGSYGEVEIELINGAAFAVTLPTVNWLVGDGTTSTTFADTGITFSASGSNTLVLWSDDAGTTVFGVAG